jgi:uncharacterized membrane protein (UPF0136 family)
VTADDVTAHAPTKPRGFTFAAATFLVLGLVSVLSQIIAASIFGIVEYLRFDGPATGGVVALIASAVMWAACRSWRTWRIWIWLPIAITVIFAFIVMSANAQTIAVEVAEVSLRQEQAQTEREFQAAAYQACVDLQLQIEAKATEIRGLQAKLDPASRPSWVTEPPSWALPGAVNEHDRLVAEFNSSC